MVKNNINQHDFFINSEVSYQSDNIITAIDIGSDKIICFIAKIDKILDKEKPRIVGFGHSQSKGIRNGAITNITETVITTAGSNLTVIASAEHIPNTWTVIGLSSSRGSVNNALFFLENNGSLSLLITNIIKIWKIILNSLYNHV